MGSTTVLCTVVRIGDWMGLTFRASNHKSTRASRVVLLVSDIIDCSAVESIAVFGQNSMRSRVKYLNFICDFDSILPNSLVIYSLDLSI